MSKRSHEKSLFNAERRLDGAKLAHEKLNGSMEKLQPTLANVEKNIKVLNSKKKVTPGNDLFSRFEQQTLILEKLAETMDPTTDRHGHDGPSRGARSKILRILKIGY